MNKHEELVRELGPWAPSKSKVCVPGLQQTRETEFAPLLTLLTSSPLLPPHLISKYQGVFQQIGRAAVGFGEVSREQSRVHRLSDWSSSGRFQHVPKVDRPLHDICNGQRIYP